MSFASDIKSEISKVDIFDVCCARAELAGLICFGAGIKNDEMKLRTENPVVTDRFCKLVSFLYKIDVDVTSTDSGIYCAYIKGPDSLKILRDTKLAGIPMHIEREIVRNDCCKSSFLRGMFLGGGSIINPEKSYHAEFVSNHYSIEKDLKYVFEYFELYPKMINRKGNFVFYIKETQQLENLMAAIGAHSKMMELVNIVIEREIINSTQRLVNFEVANDTKVFETAQKQKMAIEKIVLEHGWQSMSPELVAVAKLRLSDMYMSLGDMAKVLGISKSGVNHRMRKILALAEMED